MENAVPNEPMMKWNQEDLGKALQRDLYTRQADTVPEEAILAPMKEDAINLKAREHSWSGDRNLIGLCIRLWIVPVFQTDQKIEIEIL